MRFPKPGLNVHLHFRDSTSADSGVCHLFCLYSKICSACLTFISSTLHGFKFADSLVFSKGSSICTAQCHAALLSPDFHTNAPYQNQSLADFLVFSAGSSICTAQCHAALLPPDFHTNAPYLSHSLADSLVSSAGFSSYCSVSCCTPFTCTDIDSTYCV